MAADESEPRSAPRRKRVRTGSAPSWETPVASSPPSRKSTRKRSASASSSEADKDGAESSGEEGDGLPHAESSAMGAARQRFQARWNLASSSMSPWLQSPRSPPRRGSGTSSIILDQMQGRNTLIAGGASGSIMHAIRIRQRALASAVHGSEYRFCRTLTGHKSCVNALAWSTGDAPGRWLASGGDDMRVHVRDMALDIEESASKPVAHLIGHKSNIFSIAWSCDNRHIFSGGNDDRVLFYDLTHSPLPLRATPSPPRRSAYNDTIADHEDSIREVSCHPTNPALVLSCSDDGELELLDTRLSHDMVAGSRLARASFSGVQWNPSPSDGNTFVVSTMSSNNGALLLFDARTAFRSSGAPLGASEALIDYAVRLQRRQAESELQSTVAEISSVQFDPEGKMLATNVSLYKPTLYAVGDPLPLAVMSTTSLYPHAGLEPADPVGGRRSMDAPQGYHNSCTVKHGSFGRWGGSGMMGLAGDLVYCTGSDDFRAYGWRVPPLEELQQKRDERHWETWASEKGGKGEEPRYVGRRELSGLTSTTAAALLELSRPAFTLEGAQSIANITSCHPTLPQIAVAGVERVLRLYSATPLSASDDWGDPGELKTRKRLRIKNSAAVARELARSGGSGAGMWGDDDDDEASDDEGEDEMMEDGYEDEDAEQEAEELLEAWRAEMGPTTEEEDGGDRDEESDEEGNPERARGAAASSGHPSNLPVRHRNRPRRPSDHGADREARRRAQMEYEALREAETLALFDELLREDERRRLFDGMGDVRGWGATWDEESEGEDEQEDDAGE